MVFKIGDRVICINPDDESRFGKIFTITSERKKADREVLNRHAGGNDFWDWYQLNSGNGGMRIGHMRKVTKLDKALK